MSRISILYTNESFSTFRISAKINIKILLCCTFCIPWKKLVLIFPCLRFFLLTEIEIKLKFLVILLSFCFNLEARNEAILMHNHLVFRRLHQNFLIKLSKTKAFLLSRFQLFLTYLVFLQVCFLSKFDLEKGRTKQNPFHIFA